MFSFPLYERLKAETPEFEQVAAFQAGGARVSVRREGVDTAARPLRSEFVTGNYFTTLGVGAFGGRVLTPDDDKPSAPPVVVLSHHVWQGAYGGDTSVVGSTFVVEGHPFTVIGVAPPGFFGDTLRSDPPDLWIPLQQEPLIDGDSALLRQPVSAMAARDWPVAAGRLGRRHGAAPHRRPAAMDAARVGIPGQLDARRDPHAAQADDRRRACRRRRRRDERRVRTQPADPAGGVRARAAHRLRECGEPAARACGRAPDANGRASRRRRHADANRHAGAGRKRPARGGRRHRRACWSPWAPRGSSSRWPSRMHSSCPSARGHRSLSSRSRSGWRW